MTTFTPGPLARLALFAYGADSHILALCPPHERKRLVQMGLLVMAPAVLALFSGHFAAATFSANPWVVNGCSLLYAALVFILDRGIVMLSPGGRLTPALASRAVMAVVMSLLVAEPLVLGIFHDEINQREQTKREAIHKEVAESCRARRQLLENEISEADQAANRSQRRYEAEYNGTGGTRHIGIGDIAHADSVQWKINLEKATQVRLRNEARLHQLDSIAIVEIDRRTQSLATGLAGRLATLHEIVETNWIIAWGVWLMRLFLFCIEILPLMLKFGPSDEEHPDVYARMVALRTREHLMLMHNLTELRLRNDQRAGQIALLDQRDALETRMLHRIAETRRIQIAFILERKRSIQRLKKEAVQMYDALETDPGKQAAYQQFVAHLSEEYERKLFQLYQRFAAEELPE